MTQGGAGHPVERGGLAERLRRRRAHALERGALQPISSECEVVEEAEIRFVVRIAPSLDRKLRAPDSGGGRANPFLPYDEDLFVAELSGTHVALLNKFNVLPFHLLIVTRDFAEQEAALDASDFEALARGMAEIDSLGFYNAGSRAGASQRHKHLQLVPVPLGAGPERTPLDRVLDPARGEVAVLPFRHALAGLESALWNEPARAAAALLERYGELRTRLGLERAPRPYNLLVTRAWMLLVPRSRESFESIEVNALGFAGALLVRSRGELDALRRLGPLAVLRGVSEPRA